MKSKSMEIHKKGAPKSVKAGIITLSDSKYKDFLESKDTDVSGKLINDALNEKNEVLCYSVIPDDSKILLSEIEDMIEKGADIILTSGGTGIGSRDITIETLRTIFNKELDGFGEIFRYESYKEVGTGALLSRATAGVYGSTVIVSMPGSPDAVNLGLRLILPELGHLVKHATE